MLTPPGSELTAAHASDISVDLFVAEYEALMTRNSYLLYIQYAFWPAGVVVLTLAGQIWTSNWGSTHGWLIGWGTFAAMLIIAITWGQTLQDMYSNVTYLERILKPRVARTANLSEFWQYEVFQAARRGTGWLLEELVAPVSGSTILAGMIAGSLHARLPLSWVGFLGLFSIAGIVVWLWRTWVDVHRLRVGLVQDSEVEIFKLHSNARL